MVSVFDQYQSVSKQQTVTDVYHQILPTDAKPMNDNLPMFSRRRVNLPAPKAEILHFRMNNNFMVMVLANNTLCRELVSDQSREPEEIDLAPRSSSDVVRKIFVDPSGYHIIVCMKNQENFYLSRNGKKHKVLSKLKGVQIHSVAWNEESKEVSSYFILLGCANGEIMETEVNAVEEGKYFGSASVQTYLKTVFTISQESSALPVTGLAMCRLSPFQKRYVIFASTVTALYCFVGDVGGTTSSDGAVLVSLFRNYETSFSPIIEYPGDFTYSELHLCRPQKESEKHSMILAWMCGKGVVTTKFVVSESLTSNSVMKESKLVYYPQNPSNIRPLSIALTEYHLLLLYSDCIRVICLLNNKLTLEDPIKGTQMLGIHKDIEKNKIWVYSKQEIHRYSVLNESRNIWHIYLEQKNFKKAAEYAKGNPDQLNEVLMKHAEHLFDLQQFEESANLYGLTRCSFEEVALKFIDADRDSLKNYLLKKLDILKSSEKTQMTMLVLWIIEIFLTDLSAYNKVDDLVFGVQESVEQELRQFLRLPRLRECLTENKSVIYDLMGTHGDHSTLVFFAQLMDDTESVVQHFVQNGDYDQALEVLGEQTKADNFYKFSSLLMREAPEKTVKQWKRQGQNLNPKFLIPAIVQLERNERVAQQAINYLEFCIDKLENKEKAIHNYVVTLYAMYRPDALLTYLEQQVESECCYDLDYALRTCLKHEHRAACVHIYKTMGLYVEAVDLALESGDIDSAKRIAESVKDKDTHLEKKLWLRIARHVVMEHGDVEKAMEFIANNELLKIEDILPFFSDFVKIDHFKDAIINSLKSYNERIQKLKAAMNAATKTADQIRQETRDVRHKQMVVSPSDNCAKCSYPLLTRPFYVFPCHHCFHSDCLLKTIKSIVRPGEKSRIQQLEVILDNTSIASGSDTDSITATSAREELDDTIAKECLLCGEQMIKTVEEPFIPHGQLKQKLESWKL